MSISVSSPLDPKYFIIVGQSESSITLQWDNVNSSISYGLQFNGGEASINASSAVGPVTYTASSLSPATEYTFTLFYINANIRSSGLQLTSATGEKNYCF